MIHVEACEEALHDFLLEINSARRQGIAAPEEAFLQALFKADEHLAFCTSAPPIAFDNPYMAQFAGQWGHGSMRARKVQSTSSIAIIPPAFHWDAAADPVAVHVLRTSGVQTLWHFADSILAQGAFVRVLAPCQLANGQTLIANIYEHR